eukprot:CAMPEP_0179192024 /NCGR_PEP_ID=MMETSP0796-20121207/95388_1 /TAXON_ID=73915 /ORGANISM="Pyrodinium bahamense, Strain pbaha01" /LENGTH=64 /DNA_ID=CAMNT_0020896265 /DNA_START=103 /DNA_END=295 /DNA_ORIENTATION=+
MSLVPNDIPSSSAPPPLEEPAVAVSAATSSPPVPSPPLVVPSAPGGLAWRCPSPAGAGPPPLAA